MTDAKPRVRVPAGSVRTADSFQNFATRTGLTGQNLLSGSTYGFNPISRNRQQLEWMYRGAWLVRQVVDAPSSDMTRAGISISSSLDPGDMGRLYTAISRLQIMQRIADTIRWARLYGGCIAVMMIDGQRTETPLNLNTIKKDQFKGLLVLDRWVAQPDLSRVVTELSPDFGMPEFYQVVADAPGMPRQTVHYSRIIRMDGAKLPFYQRQTENGWGLSVIEPLYDRMVAFDSATMGAAQLVYKAHLRTYKVDGLRDIIAAGGKPMEALVQQMEMIRLWQSNEGLTLIHGAKDGGDEFQAYTYSFAGLSDVLIQFGQQIAGATQIPLVRLFGQSPAGMNATGESDLKLYEASMHAQQESEMRGPMTLLLDVLCRSELGAPPPEGFDFSFNPIWTLTEGEKIDIAGKVAAAVSSLEGGGIIDRALALKELRQSSRVTGFGSNITDDDIVEAEMEPPPPQEGDDGEGGKSALTEEPGDTSKGSKSAEADAVT